MPETGGVNAGGGIKNLGSEFSRGIQYEYKDYNKKQKVFKLKIGEIVQGTVLNVPSPKEALVRLPIGVMNAELHGSLKKGDSLFFRVEAIEPALVLKIHSVPVLLSGKQLTNNEIIRILDLPDNHIFIELIGFLKKQRNTINRNEALILSNNLHLINESDIKIQNRDAILKTIYFLNESKLKFDIKVFNKLVPVFLGANYFESKINQLFKNIKDLSGSLGLEFNNSIKKILSSGKYNILEFFMPKVLTKEVTSSFSSLLNGLLSNTQSTSLPDMAKINSSVDEISNIMEGQLLQNLIASRTNQNMYIYLPYFYQGNLLIFQLSINFQFEDENSKLKKLNFSFKVDTDNINEVSARGSVLGKSLNAKILVEDSEIKAHLEENINELKLTLQKDDFIVQSLSVLEIDNDDINQLQDSKSGSGSSFSVVI